MSTIQQDYVKEISLREKINSYSVGTFINQVESLIKKAGSEDNLSEIEGLLSLIGTLVTEGRLIELQNIIADNFSDYVF